MNSEKRKILHLAHEMGVGGTQQVIKQLINHLDADRFDCSVACIDGMVGMIGEELQKQGTVFHVFDRQPGFDRRLIGDIRSLIRSEQIDIVHCHQYTPYSYGVLAALFAGVEVVFTEHGRFYPDSYSWKRRIINPLLQRATDSIVAISAATADALAEYEWFTRRAISVVYNGTEVKSASVSREEIRAELGIAESTLVFGTIARFDPIKNLSMMIEGFQAALQEVPDAKLLMVGDGEEREALEAQVAGAGLSDTVIFTGYQSETGRYMSAIDMYLLTSFSEGTSMTLLEAMANEKAPVVTAVGGNIEIVEHLKNGVVIDSDDTASLTKWMIELSQDQTARKRLGSAARAEFEKRFSVQSMASQYESIYERCLN